MRTEDLIRILIVFRLGYLETRAKYGSYTYCYCFSAWIFGNPCERRILYLFLLFSAWIFGHPYELRIFYVLLLFLGLDIWKPVRNKDLVRILIVFRLGYLETRAK